MANVRNVNRMQNPHHTLKLGWFSTGGGEGSRGLLLSTLTAIENGTLNAEIEFVFCNREPGEDIGTDAFLEIVASHNIPTICLSSRQFAKTRKTRFSSVRQEYDTLVLSKLARFTARTCVLAGYMLVLSPSVCETYQLLNLHPAKPSGPIGTWREVIELLINDRQRESGIMMHIATKEVDQGPVLSYCTFPIRDSETDALWDNLDHAEQKVDHNEEIATVKDQLFTSVRSKQLLYERPFFVETLRALANERIKSLDVPLDLTKEVNQSLAPEESDSSSE